jgi:hypothetical protein
MLIWLIDNVIRPTRLRTELGLFSQNGETESQSYYGDHLDRHGARRGG